MNCCLECQLNLCFLVCVLLVCGSILQLNNTNCCEYKEIHYLYFTFIHLNIVQ